MSLAHNPERPVHACASDCVRGGQMRFVAHIAAPGYGQAWECEVCERRLTRIGEAFYDPAVSGPFELDPEDVR